MSAFNLAGSMDALAAATEGTTAVTKCHAWPVETATTGEGIVGYPAEDFGYDQTFRRGSDRATLPVWVLCGLPQDKETRTAVSALLTGADSIKTAIEAYSTSAWASVRVSGARVELYPIGGGQQVTVRFDCDIIS